MTLAAGAGAADKGTFEVLADVPMPPDRNFFGEGVALFPAPVADGGRAVPGQAGTLVQITWQDKLAIIYRPADLAVLGRFPYATTGGSEGWGITYDGASLIVSDGSAHLLTWDLTGVPSAPALAPGAPYGYRETRRVVARDAVEAGGVATAEPSSAAAALPVVRPRGVGGAGASVHRLNELEYVHGWVMANVWMEDQVAIIDPASGAVVWYLDFAPLRAEQTNADADVLNGLAYTLTLGPTSPAADGIATQPWGGRLWVTGKQWETVYEIELSGLRTPRLNAAAAAVAAAGGGGSRRRRHQ